MSLLQNPLKTLDQIEWYLANQHLEIFPGAFFVAAGNLARQTLEQILFILAFYSRMPHTKYMKPNKSLETAGAVLAALHARDPSTGRTYLEEARRRGPRIRKFARHPRSLNRWREQLNEPSHFRNPVARPSARVKDISDFGRRVRPLFDATDPYLITAAVNEVLSKGRVKAILGSDARNTPGVRVDLRVSPRDLVRNDDGALALRSPEIPIAILPNDREVPLRWSKKVILVQHSIGMMLEGRFVNEEGAPVDLSSMDSVLGSFAKTQRGRRRLERRMKELGCLVRWRNPT
jgi:hypothetical protein